MAERAPEIGLGPGEDEWSPRIRSPSRGRLTPIAAATNRDIEAEVPDGTCIPRSFSWVAADSLPKTLDCRTGPEARRD